MKNRMFKLGLALGAIAAVGCAQKKEEAAATGLYTTSFSMGGSAAPRTVAFRSPIEELMSLVMPNATAGIPTNMVDSQDVSVNLTKAWIVVKEIEFKAAETTAEESEDEAVEEIQFRGPYFVDLLAATPEVLDTKTLPAKVYRRIEMKLEAAEDESSTLWPVDAPAGLANRSMYFEGTFGPSNTAFTFSSNDGTEFKVSGANGIAPEEGQNILMSIRFADIIRKIDLTALASATDKDINDGNRIPATDPCPTIESGISDIFTCFRKGMENEADIGKDSDGSGELEDDEDQADN